ncbi:bifunctional diguanylate cyclase/phosphodiesterase [Brevibacillus dissolubilis]|uniref:bifunctional diguanylate cyclase/phosphodiesterase n=1 Tax=Brevibacillus dissolubilis TaxID=1844116 RepID=UPI001117021C|nr:GGDEF domain-containing phosphodiesterase [Brevibacillus dissolubilis]
MNENQQTEMLFPTAFNEAVEAFHLLKQQHQQTKIGIFVLHLGGLTRIHSTYGFSVVRQAFQKVNKRLTAYTTGLGHYFSIQETKYYLYYAEQDGLTLQQFAEGVINLFAEPLRFAAYEFYLQAKVGLSVLPDDGSDLETLLKNAEAASYYLKNEKIKRVGVFTPETNALLFKKVFYENNLIDAVKNKEFLLYYQPKICAHTGRIISLEGLVRWDHPLMGLVPPGEFVSLAEENGLIHLLGEIVLEKGVRFLSLLQSKNLDISITINVSAEQLLSGNLLPYIQNLLAANPIPTHRLGLEITENINLYDLEYVIEQLHTLRDMGIKVYLDDFGTGYSSLQYLQQLPLDVLKIDRAFVMNLEEREVDQLIIRSIVGISKKLDLEIVAEGVENPRQLEILRSLGCSQLQGYLFSKPLPEDDILSFIETYSPVYFS